MTEASLEQMLRRADAFVLDWGEGFDPSAQVALLRSLDGARPLTFAAAMADVDAEDRGDGPVFVTPRGRAEVAVQMEAIGPGAVAFLGRSSPGTYTAVLVSRDGCAIIHRRMPT
jgi:hypothetical protein